MAARRSDGDDPRVVRTRQHALRAALDLVAESGLQGCTFETVSERCGVARSTLYRHWDNKSELIMDALRSQLVERVSPDTGNLRDDMLTAMLHLGRALQNTAWGSVVAQLMAAARLDPDMARIQQADSEYNTGIDMEIITRAITRGEVADDLDPKHTALLFSAPIFYRHLFDRQSISAKWITAHVDTVAALVTRG